MKKAVSIRKIDNLGRIVIPMDIRRALEINEWDELRISLEDGHVRIQKAVDTCTFCDATENLIPFAGKQICPHCLQQLQNK